MKKCLILKMPYESNETNPISTVDTLCGLKNVLKTCLVYVYMYTLYRH